MKVCKVYKGLDTPCKIKGVLSRYFYMVFSTVLLSFVFVLISFTSMLGEGSVGSFLGELLFEFGIPVALYVVFYKKSNKSKIKKDLRTVTVSNRELFRTLNKKRSQNG